MHTFILTYTNIHKKYIHKPHLHNIWISPPLTLHYFILHLTFSCVSLLPFPFLTLPACVLRRVRGAHHPPWRMCLIFHHPALKRPPWSPSRLPLQPRRRWKRRRRRLRHSRWQWAVGGRALVVLCSRSCSFVIVLCWLEGTCDILRNAI